MSSNAERLAALRQRLEQEAQGVTISGTGWTRYATEDWPAARRSRQLLAALEALPPDSYAVARILELEPTA